MHCPPPRVAARPAFTLIEILISMALFAAGFAAVAAMLPAGIMMEKDLRNDTDAGICSRNALAIMKGKGVHTLTMEFTTRSAEPGNGLMPLNNGPLPNRARATYDPVKHDMENATNYLNLYNGGGWDMRDEYSTGGVGTLLGAHISQISSESGRLRDFWDSNANNCVWQGTQGNGPHTPLSWGGRNYFYWPTDKFWLCFMDHQDNDFRNHAITDHTHWGMGRIHAFKNRRPQPYTLLDFSYPSSIMDLSARSQVTAVLFCNLAAQGSANDRRFPDPQANDWKLVAITTYMPSGAEWPEQVEADPLATVSYPAGTNLIYSTVAADMRPSTSARCGDTRGPNPASPVPNSKDPEYWTENWIRGMADYKTMCAYEERSNGINSSAPANWVVFGNYVASTLHDTDGKYKLPTPLTIPAIVYDKGKDLLLLRYPPAFQRADNAANPRLTAFRGAHGIAPATWIDRKLKVGDPLMTNGGFTLRVKDVLDPVAAAASAPYGPVDWSDGTYQIVRVTPSLATLPFTDNKSAYLYNTQGSAVGVIENNEWTEPYLKSVTVAPPPIAGGASPWAGTATLTCGHNNSLQAYSNQNPFRNWTNTAE